MNKNWFYLLLLVPLSISAQNAVHHFGGMRIHENATVGFHTDLVNDGSFDQNRGLVGFYSSSGLRNLSGTFTPKFEDVEFATEGGLNLEIPLLVDNNANFISGNIITDKAFPTIYLGFTTDGFYVGQGANTKVYGYSAVTAQSDFTFPVGLEGRLRPLMINSSDLNVLAKCAYFFENPNSPSTSPIPFDTDSKEGDIIRISDVEYWKLEGSLPSNITIGWDAFSQIGLLASDINDLVVVGWDRDAQQWVNLGNIQADGDLNTGAITSQNFVPNEYTALSFGSLSNVISESDLANYILSPNGDGINDFLEIAATEDSPNNLLSIYNRHGGLVFQQEDYSDEFVGKANQGIVYDKGSGLPSGVYFYVIELKDTGIKHQGYLHLTSQ